MIFAGNTYAEAAKKIGLTPGLYFSHPDAGHVQLRSAAGATDVYSWAQIDEIMKARFRAGTTGPFAIFPGDQAKEYQVMEFAAGLANREEACLSISVGGPQIMGFNHDVCGYPSATALFDAFAADQRWHVLGFFDFGQSKNLLDDIRKQRWTHFGAVYNGDGAIYGPKIADAFANKAKLQAMLKA